MPDAALAKEVTIWTDAPRAAVVGRIIDLLGSSVRPIGVGGSRSAEVAALARDFECPFEDDFRKLMVDRPATFLLVASMDNATRQDVAAAAARGSIVLAIEPTITDVESLASTKPPGDAGPTSAGTGRIIPIPAFLRSPGWLSADPMEALGRPQFISFRGSGSAAECSLFARLYDAWHTVLVLGGLPESIDASLTGSLSTPPATPQALTGNFAAHARLPDGAAAVVEVRDRPGPTSRRLRIVSAQAQLRATDWSYQLHDAAGNVLDEKPAGKTPSGFEDLVVAQWTRLLDRPDVLTAEPPGHDEGYVLACCLASLLSIRTGQPESPATLLTMR